MFLNKLDIAHEIYPKRLQVFADISKQSSEYIDINAKFQLVDSDKVKNINMNYSTESASTASSYNPYLHYFLNKAAVEKINYGKLIDMNYYSINKNKESNLYLDEFQENDKIFLKLS